VKVFLSWSGEISRQVAGVLRDWLPSVIQALDPYVSSDDIDKGARWSTDIAKELEASSFGIVCVTPENLEAPWLHFEAGALSKTVDRARVCPFLFGVKRSEVQGPLLQFQSAVYEQEDVKKMMFSLNSACGQAALDEGRLGEILEMWWPRLKGRLDDLQSAAQEAPVADLDASAKPGTDDRQGAILEEILELARSQQRLLRSPEEILPPGYLVDLFRRLGALAPPRPDPEARERLKQALAQVEAIVDHARAAQGLGAEAMASYLAGADEALQDMSIEVDRLATGRD